MSKWAFIFLAASGLAVAFLIIMLIVACGSALGGTGGSDQPAATTEGTASCEKLSGTPKEVIDKTALEIAHTIDFKDITPESVKAANAAHSQLTSSRNPSDHKGPPDVAWAADISNGSSPTPEMDKLAKQLAECFGVKWSGSGLVNAEKDGYRIQLIYRTLEGGNHFNHVHIGVRKE